MHTDWKSMVESILCFPTNYGYGHDVVKILKGW